MGMDQPRMEMNQYREEQDYDRVDMNQCRADMNQLQANMDQLQVNVERSRGAMNQFQVNMERPRGDMDQLLVNSGQPGGDMDQLQMNIGQFQVAKIAPRVDKIRLRVKKNLRRADGDRLPQIALKAGSSPGGFSLERLHLEQGQRQINSSTAIGPKAIELEAIDLEAIGLGTIDPEIISLEAELPEVLFDGMRAFIAANPGWDQYSLITSALACFLFQNGCSDKCVTQHYLDSLFSRN